MIHGRNYSIFKILLIPIDWNFKELYEWDLLILCKQTSF